MSSSRIHQAIVVSRGRGGVGSGRGRWRGGGGEARLDIGVRGGDGTSGGVKMAAHSAVETAVNTRSQKHLAEAYRQFSGSMYNYLKKDIYEVRRIPAHSVR